MFVHQSPHFVWVKLVADSLKRFPSPSLYHCVFHSQAAELSIEMSPRFANTWFLWCMSDCSMSNVNVSSWSDFFRTQFNPEIFDWQMCLCSHYHWSHEDTYRIEDTITSISFRDPFISREGEGKTSCRPRWCLITSSVTINGLVCFVSWMDAPKASITRWRSS